MSETPADDQNDKRGGGNGAGGARRDGSGGSRDHRDDRRRPAGGGAPREGRQGGYSRDGQGSGSRSGGTRGGAPSRDGQSSGGYRGRDGAGSRDGQSSGGYRGRDGAGNRDGQAAGGHRGRDGGGSRDGQSSGGYRGRDVAASRDGQRGGHTRGAAPSRDGQRPSGSRDGQRPTGGRDGRDNRDNRGGRDEKLWTREGRPARGDRDARDREPELTEEERMARELRSVRPRHDDPEIPEAVEARDLDKGARVELKTLSKENADWVARHLVMAARLIEDDPELAHQHALSAARRAGRIGVVRETLAITAYATEDFALALRELRTYRRISGSNAQLPLMVDSERGVGRADRALELGRSVDRSSLPVDVQVALAIAMSGARLDLGQNEAALAELEVPQLDPNRAFSWSPDLFHAYADVLEELGRTEQSTIWRDRATRAEDAIGAALSEDEHETVDIVEEEFEIFDVDGEVAGDDAGADAPDQASGSDEAGAADEASGSDEEPADEESTDGTVPTER